MVFVLADFMVNVVLFIIMVGVGLTIEFKDFKHIFLVPRELITGLVLQLIALPLLAFFVAEISGLSNPIKAGIVILAACPGGTTSNFMSYLSNAKTSLSIALTSVNSILILISIPFITHFVLSRYLQVDASITLPFMQMVLSILMVVLIPALVGMFIRRWKHKLAVKLQNPIKITSITLMLLFFGVKFFAESSLGGSQITPTAILEIIPFVLILHLLALATGFFVSLLMKFDNRSAITLGIEVGMQNTTLALLITSAVLSNDLLSYPALVYAMFSFLTTLAFAFGTKYMLSKTRIPFEQR